MNSKVTTKEAAKIQETRIANKFNGFVVPNSGAGQFKKSDVIVKPASLSIECKTCMIPKESFSIKKEWFNKHKEEAFSNRLDNHIIAFNFNYSDKQDFYIINDTLMQFLVNKLIEDLEETK